MNKTVEIILLSRCNFSCDYCISDSNQEAIILDPVSGERTFVKRPENVAIDANGDAVITSLANGPSPEDVRQIIEAGHLTDQEALDIKKLTQYIFLHLEGWDLVLSGGEPLLYPNLDQYVNLWSIQHNITILTNASKIQEHLSLVKNPKIFFRVGFHPEYRALDEFYENISFLKQYTDNYIINYVHHPRHAEKRKDLEYIAFLKENGFNYEVSPFKGEYKKRIYSYESSFYDESILSSHFIEKFPSEDILIPGKEFLTMYGNGILYSCHNKRGIHGTLEKGNFSLDGARFIPRCLDGRCDCDSMRAYHKINTLRKCKSLA